MDPSAFSPAQLVPRSRSEILQRFAPLSAPGQGGFLYIIIIVMPRSLISNAGECECNQQTLLHVLSVAWTLTISGMSSAEEWKQMRPARGREGLSQVCSNSVIVASYASLQRRWRSPTLQTIAELLDLSFEAYERSQMTGHAARPCSAARKSTAQILEASQGLPPAVLVHVGEGVKTSTDDSVQVVAAAGVASWPSEKVA